MGFNVDHFWARDECPICGDKNPDIFYSNALDSGPVGVFIGDHYKSQGNVDYSILEGTDYDLCQCRKCTLIYQKNVPRDHVLEQVYSRWISHEKLLAFEKSLLTVRQFEQVAGEFSRLFKLLGKAPADATILDFGFGHGRWARVARAMGAKVYATEIGDDKPTLAAAIGVEMISGDDIKGMKFDIVHTEQVFEHLTEPAETFKTLAASTKGIFKLAVPRHYGVRALLQDAGFPPQSPFNKLGKKAFSKRDRTVVAIQPLEHLNTYTDDAVRHLARQFSMKIVGTSRQRAVFVDVNGIKSTVSSLKNLSRYVGKRVMPDNGGYWLLRPM